MDQKKTGYKHILHIALPIILGGLAENIINVTDTAFVSRLGEAALGAVGMGSLYFYTFVLIAVGLSQGAQIIIGRRNGEKSYGAVGALADNALYVFAGIGAVLFLLLQVVTPALLQLLIKSPEVYSQCLTYVNVRSYGVLFISLTVVFRAFFIGITRTKIITAITVIMALVNVLLDYLLIFGHYGFPQMGVAGAAWASVTAEFTALAGFMVFAGFWPKLKKYRLFRFPKPSYELAGAMLTVGFPLMLQSWIAVSSWFVFFLFVEKMGERALAVSSIVKSIYIVCMIPIWGFGSAANTLVSNAMGAQRQHEVKTVLKKVLLLCGLVTLFMIQGNIFFPELILTVYSSNASVVAETILPLRIISVSLLIFSAASVLFQAVSGAGATKVSLRIELVTLCLYMSFIVLAAGVFNASLPVVWASELVYTSAMLTGSALYLRTGKWKSIKL